MVGQVDVPRRPGPWHSSCGHKGAQLCHCELPPKQWTEHYCHPAENRGGRTKSQLIQHENLRALQFKWNHMIDIIHGCFFFQ